MKLASSIALLVSLLTASSIHAKWGRIPVMQEKAINLVLGAVQSGTKIDSSSGIGTVDNLLNAADPTAAASVAAGKSFFVIGFNKPIMIATSSFANDGIEGKISLSASADKAGWAVLAEQIVSAADRDINFKFAGIQAKFLKFEFQLSKGGSIRSLNITGGATDRGYALKQDASGQKGQPMNFVGGLGGARLIYAAPKPANGLDTAANFNKFEFPESDEKYRTLIYDFGQVRILNEFSSVNSPSPVRFEVFSFEKLPEKQDWRGRMAFDPADFNLKSPVASVEDKIGIGHIKAKPASPVKTRYLALRWEPDFNPPAFLVSQTGVVGNAIPQGPQTTTTVINGQTVTVTVEQGSAIGAGTSESTAVVTVTTTNSAGETSTVSYSGVGVTGAIVTSTGVSIVTGSPPNGAPSDTPATVATVNITATGVTAAPTAVGFILGVVPEVTGTAPVTVQTIPTAGADSGSNSTAVAVVAAALGISGADALAGATNAINAVVQAVNDNQGSTPAVIAAAIETNVTQVVVAAGGDAGAVATLGAPSVAAANSDTGSGITTGTTDTTGTTGTTGTTSGSTTNGGSMIGLGGGGGGGSTGVGGGGGGTQSAGGGTPAVTSP